VNARKINCVEGNDFFSQSSVREKWTVPFSFAGCRKLGTTDMRRYVFKYRHFRQFYDISSDESIMVDSAYANMLRYDFDVRPLAMEWVREVFLYS
jgi:hypothetical protein